MSKEISGDFKTKFVSWDWKRWMPLLNDKPLEVGQRYTAQSWDMKIYAPVWIDVDVVADKYGKMWLSEVETGKLWDLQDMPLLIFENE